MLALLLLSLEGSSGDFYNSLAFDTCILACPLDFQSLRHRSSIFWSPKILKNTQFWRLRRNSIFLMLRFSRSSWLAWSLGVLEDTTFSVNHTITLGFLLALSRTQEATNPTFCSKTFWCQTFFPRCSMPGYSKYRPEVIYFGFFDAPISGLSQSSVVRLHNLAVAFWLFVSMWQLKDSRWFVCVQKFGSENMIVACWRCSSFFPPETSHAEYFPLESQLLWAHWGSIYNLKSIRPYWILKSCIARLGASCWCGSLPNDKDIFRFYLRKNLMSRAGSHHYC